MYRKSCLYILILIFILIPTSAIVSSSEEKDDLYPSQREIMVKTQIEARGIKDEAVLRAMRTVKRHLFVPNSHRRYAYVDSALPIEDDQTISQPYIVAYMTEQLQLKPEHSVLEIGTGSGYQAAVLAEICENVYTIEIIESLATKAKSLLTKLGYQTIHFKTGDGYQGWKEQAPFDRIIVTAAPKNIPQPLIDQLKDGGRMVIPVGDRSQTLLVLTKSNGVIKKQEVLPVRFVPMTGKAEDL